MASDTASRIAAWMNAARDTALAVDQAFPFGGSNPSNAQSTAANRDIWSLNGSGPVSPDGAVAAARRQSGPLAAINGGNGGMFSPVVAILGLGAVVVLVMLFRRR